MVVVDLVSICGPDLVTWIWFQFLLCGPPMAIVALGGDRGPQALALA